MRLLLICLTVICGTSYADSDTFTLGSIAENIVLSYESVGKMMLGTAFTMGLGLGIAAIFKFKQHKDNPTQVTIGTPLVMLFLSAGLIFLPSFYNPIGLSLFGDDQSNLVAGGFEGQGVMVMPGYVKYQ